MRLHRRGILDGLMTLARVRPWRCLRCRRRFYARQIAWELMRYAHCPKCGSLDLQEVAGETVESGWLRSIRRIRNLPSYRCKACELAFHSRADERRRNADADRRAGERDRRRQTAP